MSSASSASRLASRLAQLSPFPSPTVAGGGAGAAAAAESARAAFARRHTAAGVGRLTGSAVAVAGRGAFLQLDTGRVMLDMTSGIGVTSLGHAHPDVAKAVADQATRVNHVQANIAFHGPQLDLVERLVKWIGGGSSGDSMNGLDRFFLWNSGAEAVEAAVKLARHAQAGLGQGGRRHVVVMQGGYHGRTLGTMGLTTSRTSYREGFGPLLPGVFVAPFPYWRTCGLDAYRGACHSEHVGGGKSSPPPDAGEEAALVDFCVEQLELLLKQQTAPEETAAVLIEPVLGEGGYVPAPPEFMRRVREVCDRNGLLMIADEVQTGFGRTGERMAMDHYAGVTPDIVVFAKGIANGYPLSGIASRFDAMESQPPGSMGGTYAGNAVSCAAACATLDVMERDDVLGNVRARGEQLMGRLRRLQEDEELAAGSAGAVTHVRGLGLMVGVELSGPPGTAKEVAAECLKRDMLLLSTGLFETMRFIPPLNVTADELDVAVDIFEDALRAVSRR